LKHPLAQRSHLRSPAGQRRLYARFKKRQGATNPYPKTLAKNERMNKLEANASPLFPRRRSGKGASSEKGNMAE
jgi:hypothetical protein